MLDLHIHTNYSDGSEEVLEILKKAQENNLKYISITDHNTCKAYDEMKKIDIKKYFSGAIITGVELTTKLFGTTIELLGYGVNTEIINKKVEQLYISREEKNLKELQELQQICSDLHIELEEFNSKLYKEKIYASTYIHHQITKNNENKKFFTCDESWNDPMVFFRKEMCNKESNFYIDTTKHLPTIEQVINLIKEANGLVFIPHIYVYGEKSNKIFDTILEKYKIDGIECYHSSFNKEQSEELLQFCNKNNLYISGGSDYHGKIKPNVKFAKVFDNKSIPSEKMESWVNKIIKEEK